VSLALRYPPPLRPGSRIFVTAPSSGVPKRLWRRLDLVIEHLGQRGFVVEQGHCLRTEHGGSSAPAAERAAELMTAFLREDLAAVFPPWGGELAIQLLELLDWERLSRTTPKWLMGFSDLSTLMLPLLLRSGWSSAHGPNLMDRSKAQSDALTTGALGALMEGGEARFDQHSSPLFQKAFEDYADNPEAAFQLTQATRWWTLQGEDEVRASGRVLAGCLDTWMHLAGTPYGDVPGFLRSLSGAGLPGDGPGCLLFLENCELSPSEVARALCQLRYAGWFEGLNALLLGRTAASKCPKPHQLTYEDAVRQSLAQVTFPVLMDVDCGHVPPQMTLIQGALAELSFRSGRGATLKQTLA